MSLKKIFTLTFAFFAITSSFAQQFNLSGSIYDSTDRRPLPGALVEISNPMDSSAKQRVITDGTGSFAFKLNLKRFYRLEISFMGYHSKVIPIRPQGIDMPLGAIYLSADAALLKEVEIKELARAVEQKEDTLSFNSRAYKTNPDASAEDLVKKMPGVELQNGRIKAQGEEVQRILVDGKPFFGDDPNIALKNLPAEMVDRVEVYDQESDQSRFTGFSDGNAMRTLNLVTKAGMRKGQFGKAYAGYGTDERYNAGLSYNNFSGNRRVTVLGLANNINQQNFSAQDLVSMLGGSQPGGGRRGWGLGGISDFIVGNQDGIATSNSFGLQYSNQWKNISEFSAGYFVNQSNTQNDQALRRTLFLPGDSLQFFESNNTLETNNLNHRFNLRMKWDIDSSNSLLYTPSLNWQGNRQINDAFSTNRTQLNELLNITENEQNTNNNAWVVSNDLLLQHKFKKAGRTISLNTELQLQWRNSDNGLLASNSFFNPPSIIPFVQSIDQLSNTAFSGRNTELNLSYTEPVGKKSQLEIRLRYDEDLNINDQKTNLADSTARYTLLDSALSNVFENRYNTYRLGLSYRFNTDKMNAMFGTYLQQAELNNEQDFPFADTLGRSFRNVLPYGFMRYRISKTRSLRMFFRSSTSAPNVRQLQEVLDNSNPLKLYRGDASLDQEINHFLVARYTASNPAKSRTLSAFIRLRATTAFVANSSFIAPSNDIVLDGIALQRGASLIRPVNLNGQRSISSNISYGFPVKKIKSNLNIGAGLSYDRIPGLVNGVENISKNTSVDPSLVLSSNISERVDFSLSYSGSYNFVQNSVQAELNSNFYNHTATLNGNFWLGKKTIIKTDLNNRLFTGLSDGYNPNFWLWNMGLARKLFKDNSGELRITAFDILGQNQSVIRNITETYLEDLENSILTRYFMLSFTYQLRSFKGGQAPAIDDDMRRRLEHHGIKH